MLFRSLILIAESDLNDTRLLRTPETGGDGLHAQWLDDFHHAVHVRLTDDGRARMEQFLTRVSSELSAA